MTSTFRALTTNVAVEIDDDLPLADIARALISLYPSADGPPTVEYQLRARPAALVRNGATVHAPSDPRDVLPVFELDLYGQMIEVAAPGFILHAAAIAVGGEALVLTGASGAGKTTLTLALAARGMPLLTEEVVWIDDSGNVRGLPRPMHVTADSAHRERIPPSWTTLGYPMRGRDGVVREHMLALPPPEALELGSLPLRAIVRMGHGSDWPTHLAATPAHVSLTKLWNCTLRRDNSGLATATTLLRTKPSYVLSSTTEAEALSLLEPLLK